MTWGGIRRDTDDTSTDGARVAMNTRFYYDGELRRRMGMKRAVSFNGVAMSFKTAADNTQYMLFVTPSGIMESVII